MEREKNTRDCFSSTQSFHDARKRNKTNAFDSTTTTTTTTIVIVVVLGVKKVSVLGAPSKGANRTTRESRDATFTTRGVRALFSRDDCGRRNDDDDDDEKKMSRIALAAKATEMTRTQKRINRGGY